MSVILYHAMCHMAYVMPCALLAHIILLSFCPVVFLICCPSDLLSFCPVICHAMCPTCPHYSVVFLSCCLSVLLFCRLSAAPYVLYNAMCPMSSHVHYLPMLLFCLVVFLSFYLSDLLSLCPVISLSCGLFVLLSFSPVVCLFCCFHCQYHHFHYIVLIIWFCDIMMFLLNNSKSLTSTPDARDAIASKKTVYVNVPWIPHLFSYVSI